MRKLRADAVDAKFTPVRVNGGVYDPRDPPTNEESMNVEYAAAISYPTPLIYYRVGGEANWEASGGPEPGNSDFEWLKYMLRLDKDKLPQTISILYDSDENVLPPEYMTTLCNLFARLGSQGVSVLVASGDDGVGSGECKDGSGGNIKFGPTFPASCTCSVPSLLCKQYTRQPRICRSVCH